MLDRLGINIGNLQGRLRSMSPSGITIRRHQRQATAPRTCDRDRGEGHETDDDADGAGGADTGDAGWDWSTMMPPSGGRVPECVAFGAGGRVPGGHGADGGGADGTGATPVPVPLRAQTGAAGGGPLGEDHGPGVSPSALGLPQKHYNTTQQQKSDTPLSEDISNRDLLRMAAPQTADVEDRAGRGHETDDDADGADAADGAQ